MLVLFAATTIGAVLGIRFKVFVLIPAITLIGFLNCSFSIAHGNDFWSTFLNMSVTVLALQLGYIAGVFTRFGIGRVRAKRDAASFFVAVGRR